VSRLDTGGPRLPYWEGDEIEGFAITGKPLKPRDVVGVFEFKGEPDPEFNPHLSLSVCLDEGPEGSWARQESLVSFLTGLRNAIAQELDLWLVPAFLSEKPLSLRPEDERRQ
jgi:hypothetical protein